MNKVKPRSTERLRSWVPELRALAERSAKTFVRHDIAENSLTVYNASGFAHGLLAVGLIWWTIGMALAAAYFVLIYHLFRGKVRIEENGY
jgi:cytochrome bd-type quinol oxidase subunit 2